MAKRRTYLLTQYRKGDQYRNFLGHLYHFPKSYINNFGDLPIEFVFYEPKKNGKGEFFGCGQVSEIVSDNGSSDHFFAIIKDYQEFQTPVPHRDDKGALREGNSPHYNPQNAVRKLPSDIFDDICLDGGISLRFKSDAHLIKVLGEQLIGSEKVGILELIKNAIDAQASYCRIRIEKVSGLQSINRDKYEFEHLNGPVIVVEDDGIGMTREVIENGWLRPASTMKTNVKEKIKKEREKAKKTGNLGVYDALVAKLKKEHGNRIPLGEKGVGRFATHRLGKFLELRTKTKGAKYELVLRIDWDKFDVISETFVDLDSIGVSISKELPVRRYGNNDSGTQLIIYGGREGFSWNEESILDLNRAILSLNSPNPGTNFKKKESDSIDKTSGGIKIFNAYLECPQIDDLPENQIYEEATPNFTLDILVSSDGIIEDSEVTFRHPHDKIPSDSWNDDKGFDLRLIDENKRNFWMENGVKRKPACGSFFIHMDVWYRRREWIDLSNWKDLTGYLDEFGGMSIYRDNILFFDAKLGSELDWLQLSKRHIAKGSRLSYRDFVGNVEIEQLENFDLTDKTNREGLIDNQAFKDLSVLVGNAIDSILLPRYIGKRDDFNRLMKGITSDPKKVNEIAKASSRIISNISKSSYSIENDPFAFFDGIWDRVVDRRPGLVNLEGSVKELQKSIELLEEVQEQFVEQAGFGISVAISLHEINKITTNFYHSVLHLIKSGQYDQIKLEELKATSSSLRTELKRLGPLRSVRNERSTEFNILRPIKYASEIFRRRMKEKNIDLIIEGEENDFPLYARSSTLNQVFGNLFDNSIYWIENAQNKDNKVKIRIDKRFRTVIVADTGTDINDVIRPYLFQPGYSLKVPKSGLGLYICKTYMDAMKASIYVTPQRDRIPGMVGAHFTLDFGRTPETRGG